MNLKSREKPGRLPTLLALLIGLSSIVLYFTPFQTYLTQQVSRPFEFWLRTWLQQSPPLDPRLRIYAFDETTVQYLGYPDLTLDGWLHLIEHFAAQKPRAIFIDKLFVRPLQERIFDPLSAEQAEQFVERVLQTGVPVISGGFISQRQLPFRDMVPLHHPDYMLRDGDGPPIESGYFYGPHPRLRPAFRVGHITNSDFGYARPYFRIDPQSLIPHAAFLTLGRLQFEGRHMRLGEQEIPVNDKKLIPINFSEKVEYVQRGKTTSLAPVIERIRSSQPEPKIKGDDIIVILPAMFTGNVDWKDTPIGRLQGGYFSVALINSALRNDWLHEHSTGNILLLLGLLSGSLTLALLLSPIGAAWMLIILALGLPIGGLVLFIYGGFIVPWLWLSVSTAMGGGIVLLERMRSENQKSKILVSSLRGALSPDLADSIAQNPKILHGDPVEQIVTVMFVDIVGFSLTTERLTARETFQQLKEQITYIVNQVHNFGGLVDKSLGDGVLAFFGYHYEKSGRRAGHADQALRCAIEIQREALRRARELVGSGQPIYPLRIGLNTATVYIGNLGTEGRIDFTLIGNGVNFTARLEQACQPYRIMMGLATLDLLGHFSAKDPGVSSRDIRIKHHKQAVRCYEYNPFHASPGELRRVLNYYGDYHKLYSGEPRWYFEPRDCPGVTTDFGPGKILNFSAGGLALLLSSSQATDGKLALTLKPPYASRSLGVVVHICWSRGLDSQTVYGCRFEDETDRKENFIEALRVYLSDKNPQLDAAVITKDPVAS